MIDTLPDLEAAARLVYTAMSPTPQQRWPLLDQRCGTTVWVKHENHTPVGAFKVRGGLVFFEELRRREPHIKGVVAATRGNHGQSIGFAAARLGSRPPSWCRTATARRRTRRCARRASNHRARARLPGVARSQRSNCDRTRRHLVPSFHSHLVLGVASYSLELFRAVPELAVLYVPVGLGSGICGAMLAETR